MSAYIKILEQHLSEQVALEEHLCKIIEKQMLQIDKPEFAEARDLLMKTKTILEQHYNPLNKLLDELEETTLRRDKEGKPISNPVIGFELDSYQEDELVSRILRDDYSALNLIAMGNAMLHTKALALQHNEVAEIALSHLKDLAAVAAEIGNLMPRLVARELLNRSVDTDPSIVETASRNLLDAVRRALRQLPI